MRGILRTLTEYLRTPVNRQLLQAHTEIQEEIQFHLESKAEDLQGQGASPQSAANATLEQFGDVRTVLRQCCDESGAGQVLLHRSHMMLTILLLAATTTLGFKVWSAPAMNNATETSVVQLPSGEQSAYDGDVAGIVVNELGKALPNANVMIAVKWWPANGFRQQCYMVTTDKSGEFSVNNVFPSSVEHEVQIAAMTDGHLLTSRYISDKDQTLDALRMEVPSVATEFALEFKSANGTPISGVAAFPHQRTDKSGVGHTVYFQSAGRIIRESDQTGRVQFSNFRPGDRAVVFVRFPDEDWQQRELVVPENESIVVITQASIETTGG